jgi:hypothetical protein
MILNTLSSWAYHHCSTRNILLAFICTIGIIALFRSSLPMTDSALRAVSGEGILDVNFNHSAAFVLQQIEEYGEKGRQIYRRFITLDLLFVFAYGTAFSLLISRLSITKPSSLNLIPWLASLSDFIENCCHLYLVTLHPSSLTAVASIASSATRFKYIFILLSLITVAYACCQFLSNLKIDK